MEDKEGRMGSHQQQLSKRKLLYHQWMEKALEGGEN